MDIEKYIKTCSTCQEYKASQTKEPMVVTEEELFPWSKAAIDLFSHAGKHYALF